MVRFSAYFISFFLPLTAFASSHCHSPGELEEIVVTCSENAFYSEAAVKCIKKFKEEVKLSTAKLSKQLTRKAANSGQTQTDNFETADEDYQSSAKALGELLVTGRQSLAEVEAYKFQIVLPFEIDEAPDPGSALRNTKCYSRNQKILDLVASDYRKQIRNLEKAQATSVGLRKISTGRGDNLEAMSAEVKTKPGSEASKEKINQLTSPKRAGVRRSDITGIKENSEKKKP